MLSLESRLKNPWFDSTNPAQWVFHASSVSGLGAKVSGTSAEKRADRTSFRRGNFMKRGK